MQALEFTSETGESFLIPGRARRSCKLLGQDVVYAMADSVSAMWVYHGVPLAAPNSVVMVDNTC